MKVDLDRYSMEDILDACNAWLLTRKRTYRYVRVVRLRKRPAGSTEIWLETSKRYNTGEVFVTDYYIASYLVCRKDVINTYMDTVETTAGEVASDT